MKVGVFTVLLADRPLGEALDYAGEVGCEAVEIGTGGYPGDAHCKPVELLRDAGPGRSSGAPSRVGGSRSARSPATATLSTRKRKRPQQATSPSATRCGSPPSSASRPS